MRAQHSRANSKVSIATPLILKTKLIIHCPLLSHNRIQRANRILAKGKTNLFDSVDQIMKRD